MGTASYNAVQMSRKTERSVRVEVAIACAEAESQSRLTYRNGAEESPMEQISSAYLSSVAIQFGTISAFLGGFAATFVATLLISRHKSRATGATIGLSAASSVAFIVCVVGATVLSTGLHPEAPAEFNSVSYLALVNVLMTSAFMFGILALLLALGVSGWTRSRVMGWVTSCVSFVGLLAVAFLMIKIG